MAGSRTELQRVPHQLLGLLGERYVCLYANTGEQGAECRLEGEVECDKVYVVAGHKGQPEAIKKGRKGRRNRLKGVRGRGNLEKEKPPIFGMIQRGGQVVIQMLENVQ